MKIISYTEARNLGLSQYFTGKPCKYGHIAPRRAVNGQCVECMHIAKTAPTRAKIVPETAHLIISRNDARQQNLKYYFTGKPCKHGHIAPRFTSRAICSECNRLNAEKNRKENPEYITNLRSSARFKEHQRNRRKYDVDYKIKLTVRDVVRRFFKLTGTQKHDKTIDLVGYSFDEFKGHIESLFTNGMKWENHGEWHVDHIIPIKYWIDQGITDPKRINALINLQPLWAEDNHRKSAKLEW